MGNQGPSQSVTIIMPAYNAFATIREAILSVQSQTFADWELIVVDDRSRDATAEVCTEIAMSDPRVKLIRAEMNGGVARARNLGLEAATGTHVAFLDSDDLWLPHKLETQFSSATRSQFLYTPYEHISIDGNFLKRVIPPESVSYRDMLGGNLIGTLTVLLSRDALASDKFPLRGHEDYALWLQVLRRVPRAERRGGSTPAAQYRKSAGSVSANKLRAAKWHWDIYRQQEQMSTPSACLHMCKYAYRSFLKHGFSR